MSLTVYKGECDTRSIRILPPAITITKHNKIAINSTLQEEIGPSWNFALLYWDANSEKLGVKLFDTQPEGDGRVYILSKSKGMLNMSAKGFLLWAGIDYSKTKRYPAHYDASKRMIVVRLGGYNERDE